MEQMTMGTNESEYEFKRLQKLTVNGLYVKLLVWYKNIEYTKTSEIINWQELTLREGLGASF